MIRMLLALVAMLAALPADAAMTVRQAATNMCGSATSCVATFPTPTLPGNLLVGCGDSPSSSAAQTFADSNSNAFTMVQVNAVSDMGYLADTQAATSVTYSWTTASLASVTVLEIYNYGAYDTSGKTSGAATGVEKAVTPAGSGEAAIGCGAATTQVATSFGIAYFGAGGGTTTALNYSSGFGAQKLAQAMVFNTNYASGSALTFGFYCDQSGVTGCTFTGISGMFVTQGTNGSAGNSSTIYGLSGQTGYLGDPMFARMLSLRRARHL